MSETANHPFEDVLASLRIEGNFLLHGVHAAPWSVWVPEAARLRSFMGLGSQVNVIPFHLVLSGSLCVEPLGEPAVELHSGDVIMSPAGKGHRMYKGAGGATLDFETVLQSRAAGHHNSAAATGDSSELLCGAFVTRSVPLNPLLASLPSVLVMQTEGEDASPLLQSATQLLKQQLSRGDGSRFVISRLLEIFCAEILGAHGRRTSRHQPGWFRGLSDARLGSVMAQIHSRPGAPWTVTSLSAQVAMSPSRFAARFREATGQSVMSYVTAWRMHCACRELLEGRRSLGEIAAEVGYQDVAAFSRAFKSLVGLSPAHWRQERTSPIGAPRLNPGKTASGLLPR